jgi:TPR repeat protein
MKKRTGVAILGGAVLAIASAYLLLLHIRREARAVDDGVVEFKKGNYVDAVRLLTPYADSGNKTAQLNLGIAYAFGLGVKRDRALAHDFLRHSTGKNSAEMSLWIAKSLENGDGVAKDSTEAIAWYRVAADEGSAEARDFLRKVSERQPGQT